MTIAACYLSPEGVVLGTDSTASFMAPGTIPHHLNFAQKLFQIGADSSLGIAMWGLGELHSVSYRTLIASFADDLKNSCASSASEIADRWNQNFWNSYTKAFSTNIQRARDLNSNHNKTQPEVDELTGLRQNLSGGFCIGGTCPPDHTPFAYEIVYDPTFMGPQAAKPLQFYRLAFWGMENLINRLLAGMDIELFNAILASKHWTGSKSDLETIINQHTYMPCGSLPLREAIDWVHSVIYATIKGMKFSHMPPVCGGPIEIAVISSDRPFRWVQHKRFSAAFERGDWDGEMR